MATHAPPQPDATYCSQAASVVLVSLQLAYGQWYISRAYSPCTHILAKTNNSLLDVTPSNPLPHPLPPPPILLRVILSSRGNIKQMSCIPQTEQHSPFGLMLLRLGNVTIICKQILPMQTHLTHANTSYPCKHILPMHTHIPMHTHSC